MERRAARSRPLSILLLCAAVLIAGVVATTPADTAAAAAPAGFSDTLIATVPAPTALAFRPDGSMLVATQGGLLRVVTPAGQLLATPAIQLPVCSSSERGLLGVTVDPDHAATGHVFVYYTASVGGLCRNRVSRLTMTGNTAGSELVLADHIPSTAGNHNAGDLAVAADGYLYVSVGDAGCSPVEPTKCAGSNDIARRLDYPLGKILRITRSGGIPPTNPYASASGARHCTAPVGVPPGTGPCAETWVSGMRNPFRFAVRPGTSELYVNDVGQNAWEEIDRVPAGGGDYGWNLREGPCPTGVTSGCSPDPRFVEPVLAYPHSSGCRSITGAAFVPTGVWPAAYEGAYLYADYVCGVIRSLRDGAVTDLVTGLGGSSAVHLEFGPWGPSQALYYTSYAGGGQVRRLAYTGNSQPTASFTVSPSSGPAPLQVSFDGSGSVDPDATGALTYLWEFGDGTTQTTTGPTTTHTYASGTFTATLRVRDGAGATSQPATRTVTVGSSSPPTVTIGGWTASDRFRVGQQIPLTGGGVDPDGGSVQLTWEVRRVHDQHYHPWASGNGSALTVTTPAPEDLDAVTNSYLEVRLTGTDDEGVTTTAVLRLDPRLVPVTLRATASGLNVSFAGRQVSTPATVTSWDGWSVQLSASVQRLRGKTWTPTGWSTGGAPTHTAVTPSTATTWTANFTSSKR